MKIVVAEVLIFRERRGKILATASVRFDDLLEVRCFQVVLGTRGVSVLGPRKPTAQGQWFDVLDMDAALKIDVENKIMEAFLALPSANWCGACAMDDRARVKNKSRNFKCPNCGEWTDEPKS